MPAVAGNFGYVLSFRRLALRAAIFFVLADRTTAPVMSAFIVFVCHISKSSLIRVKNKFVAISRQI
jgi:hypothetical protein